MLSLRNRDLVCQQAIELLTDYLEGSLSADKGSGSSATCAHARIARTTSNRSGSPSGLPVQSLRRSWRLMPLTT